MFHNFLLTSTHLVLRQCSTCHAVYQVFHLKHSENQNSRSAEVTEEVGWHRGLRKFYLQVVCFKLLVKFYKYPTPEGLHNTLQGHTKDRMTGVPARIMV